MDPTGLHKIGTGYGGTIKGKIYGSMKELKLEGDNIAWITSWASKEKGKDKKKEYILVRFLYDLDENWMSEGDKEKRSKSGKIIVVDALEWKLLGDMLQNGKGGLETADNSSHKSLGPITTSTGPIFVYGDELFAIQFEVDEDMFRLFAEVFTMPSLAFSKKRELYGPPKKGRSKASMVDCFGWGQNGCYELGLSDTTQRRDPNEIKSLPKARIVSCFAGNEVSYWLTSNGKVYGCGRNGSGQLALGKDQNSNKNVPTLIETLKDHKIIKIASSQNGSHTLFLSKDGLVFGAGNNGSGQVKESNEGNGCIPHCINDFDPFSNTKVKFVDIACASNRSCAVTSEGLVYEWGNTNTNALSF